MQSQKWQNDLCFWGKPFNIRVIQVYAPTTNDKEAEIEWFCEDLQDLIELTPQKDVLFIIGDWNAKVGSQKIPGVTGKFGLGVQNEAGQRLTEFCEENTLVIANTLLCCWKRVFAMTSAFSWQNSVSLCPASFCIPRPNLPVTPGVSWLPTFAFQSPIMIGNSNFCLPLLTIHFAFQTPNLIHSYHQFKWVHQTTKW